MAGTKVYAQKILKRSLARIIVEHKLTLQNHFTLTERQEHEKYKLSSRYPFEQYNAEQCTPCQILPAMELRRTPQRPNNELRILENERAVS